MIDAPFTPPYVLLEDRSLPNGGGRLFTDPVEVIRCADPIEVGAALDRVQAGLDRGLHAAGWLAYEAGRALEPRWAGLGEKRAAEPLVCFGLFAGFVSLSGEALDGVFGGLDGPSRITHISYGRSRDQHVADVAAVKALIAAGDVYQVNLTLPIHFRFQGDPLALYAALRARQPVAHGGVVALDDRIVLSVSPELFVSVEGGLATTRPMKGTAARGVDAAADRDAVARLRADAKQQAENLMIVDLLRNDLSRVCEAGSVRVVDLFTVETYPTFHALTSTVEGRLRPDAGVRDVLAALFPCGSVVSAPKIRAGEIIDSLEPDARGVYTGAIGRIAPGGDLAFNVAIRTAVLTAEGQKRYGVGRFGVGGGVVADSDPEPEYEEALLKGRALTELAQDFQLIETFGWRLATGFVRLPAHLARMAGSARRLGFRFDARLAENRLDLLARDWTDGLDRRVRLALDRDGAIDITASHLQAEPAQPLRLGVFETALDAADPLLRHKTSRRRIYDDASRAAAARGVDEMILLNRRDRVADGARNSIFVERQGRLLTPPIGDGALAGVLRASLIASGEAQEAALSLGDLRAAPLFIGNSLRGLRRCRFG